MIENYKKILILLASSVAMAGCTSSQLEKLENVGKEPELQKVGNPEDKSAPVRWPVARVKQPPVKTANSLWSSGSKEFFRDQRARLVGDILTVQVSIKDKAALDNKTERKRDSSEDMSAPSVFGLETKMLGVLPGNADKSNLLSLAGDSSSKGEGTIERGETIETKVAAVVTQVLPNGNMVIYGSQEIRVNYEVRQLTVEGVIRPGDISPSNTIEADQIAEARISYGGKGLISDVQQPRIGTQVIDILSPW